MEFIKLLSSSDTQIIGKYKKKILGSIKKILSFNDLQDILVENYLFYQLNLDFHNWYNQLDSHLSLVDITFLKKYSKNDDTFTDSQNFLRPSVNKSDDINPALTSFKIHLYNVLVQNFKRETIYSSKTTLNSLVQYQKDFKKEFNSFCRINFPDKNVLLTNLQTKFNKIMNIEFFYNPCYNISPDNLSNPYIFTTFNDLMQKNKINTENIVQSYLNAQYHYDLDNSNLNLIHKEVILDYNNTEILLINADENIIISDILNSNIPQNISDNNHIDYLKIKDSYIKHNVLNVNDKFWLFLKKIKLEDDHLGLGVIHALLPFININGFGKIKCVLTVKRSLNNSSFWYTLNSETIIDLKSFINPLTWSHIKNNIIKDIDILIKNNNEKYDDNKELQNMYIKEIDLEIWNKQNNNFVLGRYNIKKDNSIFNPKNISGCLFECIFYYFEYLKIIKCNSKYLFLTSLPENLQFFLLTGNVEKSFEEISKLYKLNFKIFSDNNYITYFNYEDSVLDNNFIFVIKNFHISLHKELPTVKEFVLGDIKKITNNTKPLNIAWDIETFTDDKFILGNQSPYCVCTYSSDISYRKVWWGENCIKNFIDWFDNLPPNTILWSFNGSRFDHQFIMDDLYKKYGVEVKVLGTSLNRKQILIKEKHFSDFNCFFPGSLNSVCKNFNIDGKKDFDIKNITKNNYSYHKKMIISYCIQDCKCLFECVEIFFNLLSKINIYDSINFNLKYVPTSSSLALKILKGYLNSNSISIKGSTDNYSMEKESYHGGICLVFKKKAEKVFCYDINSSYPSSMCEDLPYEIDNNFIFDSNNYEISDYDLINFDYEFENDVFSILPEKCNDGSLIYVKSHKNSTHWGIEINFMIKNFKVKYLKIHKVIRYKNKNILQPLIIHFYNLRLEEKNKINKNNTLIEMYKLVLNSIYGKFGQKFFNDELVINKLFLNKIISNNSIKSIEYLNAEYSKIIFKEDENYFNQIGSLVRLASFITARSRINLFTPMLKIGFENLIYVDTDSLFLTCELPIEYLDNDKLGKFKLEYEATEFYAVCPKVYGCKVNGIEKIKMKSCKNKFNDINQFNLSDIKRLSEDRDFIITLNSLNFTRTRDNNVKIHVIKKDIKNNFFKRIFVNNDSIIWENVLLYDNFMLTLSKKKTTIKEVKEIEKKFRQLIKEDNLYIENVLTYSLDDLIHFFYQFKECPTILDQNHYLYKKIQLLNKGKKILNKCNKWFLYFLCTNNWHFCFIQFYNDDNINCNDDELFWKQNLLEINKL